MSDSSSCSFSPLFFPPLLLRKAVFLWQHHLSCGQMLDQLPCLKTVERLKFGEGEHRCLGAMFLLASARGVAPMLSAFWWQVSLVPLGGRRVHCGQGVWTLALLGPFPCSGALSLEGRCIGKFACY